MHIPDGILDVRSCLGTGVISLGLVTAAVKWIGGRTRERERMIPMFGVLAAFIFAVQMMNFPIPGGTSGHLLGGALAAVLIGPWGGMLVLTLVLAVQWLLFADGGLTSLGANVFNMGVVGVLLAWSVHRFAGRLLKGRTGFFAGASIAAWLSVVAASTACAVEIAVSGKSPLRVVFPAMVYVHSVIGIGEALITVLVLAMVLALRPDLVPDHRVTGLERRSPFITKREVTVAVGASVLIAVVFSSFASGAPDGLEKVMERLGIETAGSLVSPVSPPIPDYAFPGLGAGFAATALAGGIGVIVLLAVGWVLYRLERRRSVKT